MSSDDNRVVIFMGSVKDRSHAERAAEVLDKFNVPYEIRALSAHKLTSAVLEEVEKYNPSGKKGKKIVYIVIAGRSNALGPIISGNSLNPVINCPVIGEWKEDVYSSLRMPSDVPCSTILDPKNAALHAVEIFALSDPDLRERLNEYFRKVKSSLKEKDSEFCSE